MKRERESDDLCLMLFPKIDHSSGDVRRFFRCKTCDKQFPSFQALGGHRASHKKPRFSDGDGSCSGSSEKKPKTVHECSICGLEFPLGQALGGHMRRHRAAAEVRGDLMTRDLLPAFGRSGSNRCLNLDLSLQLGPPSIDWSL